MTGISAGRRIVTARFVELMKAELTSFEIYPGQPPDLLQDSTIWLENTRGENVVVPYSAGGDRTTYDDTFVGQWYVWAAGNGDEESARDRLDATIDVIQAIPTEHPHLDVDVCLMAEITNIPLAEPSESAGGWVGRGVVELTVTNRLI